MTTLPAFITELLAVALRGDPLGSLQPLRMQLAAAQQAALARALRSTETQP